MNLIDQLFNPQEPSKGAWDMKNMRPIEGEPRINNALRCEVIIARSKYKPKELKAMRVKQLRRQNISLKVMIKPNRIIES